MDERSKLLAHLELTAERDPEVHVALQIHVLHTHRKRERTFTHSWRHTLAHTALTLNLPFQQRRRRRVWRVWRAA